MQKEFTSFDVAAVVRELTEAITDTRVNNIYELDVSTLFLKLHKPNCPPMNLVLEAGRRLHLTSYDLEKPSTPPSFCMALRKYLRDAKLTEIEQHEFDRVVTFTFRTKGANMKLVLELFGEGNIILVNDKNAILQALNFKRMRDRNILRGESFKFAPSSGQNPYRVNKEELQKNLTNSGSIEVVRALARLLSIGGVYAEETLLRAHVDKNRPSSILNDREVDAISSALQNLLDQVAEGKLEPQIILDEKGNFVDVVPFGLKRYETARTQLCASFSEALDEFYARTDTREKDKAKAVVDKLRREEERLNRIVESQLKIEAQARETAAKNRSIGDLIYTHAAEFQALLAKFSSFQESSKPWETIVPEILAEKESDVKPSITFESFDMKNLILNVCVEDSSFGLAIRKSLFENAAGFFERGKRAKQKLEGARIALEESRRKLGEIQTKIRMVQASETIGKTEATEGILKHKIKRKEWFEKFRWFISSEGFLVVAGKDAVSNEVLIKKYVESSDLVFHADILGAPFVIIKTGGRKPNDETLQETAEFAAAFSRGWREGFGSVDVYWVRPEQLSKGAPTGESIGTGAFVVRGERNWLRKVLLRQAVGIIVKDLETGLVGGPVKAVGAKTDFFVEIAPGNLDSKELFQRILKSLRTKLPKETVEKLSGFSVEDIREFIPFGKGQILPQ